MRFSLLERWRNARNAGARGKSRPIRLCLEILEARLLPSLTPHLLKDINPGAANSGPALFTDVSGTAFFRASNGVSGAELWKSNGTTAGTVLVKDINPGTGSSGPSYLTNVNGTLFFSATNGVSGQELWKSNGTAASTVLVKDINPRRTGSYPEYLTNVNGELFFSADNGVSGREPLEKQWQRRRHRVGQRHLPRKYRLAA